MTQSPSQRGALTLQISGLGPVPSKKNRKTIGRRKDGKPFILQGRSESAWMDAAILVLLSELNSAYRTAAAMGTTHCPLCWIVSSTPANDSSKHIRHGSFDIVYVPKGGEGAVIRIERELK
jgi:hypothetical protein